MPNFVAGSKAPIVDKAISRDFETITSTAPSATDGAAGSDPDSDRSKSPVFGPSAENSNTAPPAETNENENGLLIYFIYNIECKQIHLRFPLNSLHHTSIPMRLKHLSVDDSHNVDVLRQHITLSCRSEFNRENADFAATSDDRRKKILSYRKVSGHTFFHLFLRIHFSKMLPLCSNM